MNGTKYHEAFAKDVSVGAMQLLLNSFSASLLARFDIVIKSSDEFAIQARAPIYDRAGQRIGFCSSQWNKASGRLISVSRSISLCARPVIYNLNNLKPSNEIVITDCPSSLWALHQIGHSNSVAILGLCGVGATRELCNVLSRATRIQINVRDGPTGTQFALAALLCLTPYFHCRRVRLASPDLIV